MTNQTHRRIVRRWCGALLVLAWQSAWALAEPAMFIGLGDLPGGPFSSVALNISGDGRVIVGYSQSQAGNEAFRWEDGVMTGLGSFAGEPVFSNAHAVSINGAVIVGSATWKGETRAFSTDGKAMTVLPGSTDAARLSEAWGVSSDGSIIVGQVDDGKGQRACAWRGGAVQWLGNLPNGTPTGSATAVSADGSVIVGHAFTPQQRFAFRFADGKLLEMGDLPGGAIGSMAHGVSSDGTVIVGVGTSSWGTEGFRWRDGTMIGLGGLSDSHEFFSSARDVSADGSVIVGSSENELESNDAFIWDAQNGMRSVRDVLIYEHGIDLTGWTLSEAVAVSDDGRSIVGYGRNPDGKVEGWLARLGSAEDASATAAGVKALFHGEFQRAMDDLREPRCAAIADDGSVFVAEAGANRVSVFNADGSRRASWPESRAAGTALDSPHAVAIDPDGSVWVLDTGHHRVVRLARDGAVIGGFGGFGEGAGQLNRPEGLAVDGGHLYIADTGNDRIVVFDHGGTFIRSFGEFGDQPGRFRRPIGIAANGGHLYIADSDNHRIQKLDQKGNVVRAWGQRGRAPGFFSSPTGVRWFNGALYVTDSVNHRVQIFTEDGELLSAWGQRVVRPHEVEGKLHFPVMMTVSPSGTFAVICEPREDRCQVFGRLKDRAPSRAWMIPPPSRSYFGARCDIDDALMAVTLPESDAVQLIDLSSPVPAVIGLVGDSGSRFGQMNRPAGVALDRAKSRLVVSDAGNRRVQVFELEKDLSPNPNPAAPRQLAKFVRSIDGPTLRSAMPADAAKVEVLPDDIELDADGGMYLLDRSNGVVLILDSSLKLMGVIGSRKDAEGGLREPVDVAMGAKGSVLVLDAGDLQVKEYDASGKPVRSWSVAGEAPAPDVSSEPRGVAAGLDGSVMVTDGGNRVRKFDAEGRFVSQWGTAGIGPTQFLKSEGVAVDGKGRMVVIDWGNHRAQVFTPEGVFHTVFGAGLYVRPARLEQE